MTRAHIPHIANIRKRRWLYMDDEEDDTFLAETGIPARAAKRSLSPYLTSLSYFWISTGYPRDIPHGRMRSRLYLRPIRP